jgi:hypothetical protein
VGTPEGGGRPKVLSTHIVSCRIRQGRLGFTLSTITGVNNGARSQNNNREEDQRIHDRRYARRIQYYTRKARLEFECRRDSILENTRLPKPEPIISPTPPVDNPFYVLEEVCQICVGRSRYRMSTIDLADVSRPRGSKIPSQLTI